ncbi:acyl carrier protein [Paenibacillus polymyxa]|uniref:acyl carrier protein n=1 Tax=Paenibacillus polymyxa TaxID=1406 RepID=UPI00321708EA
MNIKERIQTVFDHVFYSGKRQLEITATMSAEDIEAWSSLKHFKLIAGIEKEFDIQFTNAELRQINTMGDFVTVVDSKIS